MITSPRYEPREADGGWIVFDTFRQEPVVEMSPEYPARPVARTAAIRACARLNRAYTLAITDNVS